MARVRKDKIDMRQSFIKEMDELAFNLAGAVKRLPSNMLTEKIDAFKALTQYANTINRTPVSEEGNAIDSFREALGVAAPAAGAGGSARGGSAGPGADPDDGDDDDGDDGDDEEGEPDFVAPDPTYTVGPPQPSAGVSGAGNGAGGPVDGLAVGHFRHSVRLPDDQ